MAGVAEVRVEAGRAVPWRARVVARREVPLGESGALGRVIWPLARGRLAMERLGPGEQATLGQAPFPSGAGMRWRRG